MMTLRILAVALLAVTSVPALGQNDWTVASTSPGATGMIGVTEDFLTMGTLWDPDGMDDCGQLFDVRCEWMVDHTGDDPEHMMNGVLAATLDGSMINQQAVFLSEEWSDLVSSGSTWWVTYAVHFIAVDPADIPTLRLRSRYLHNGIPQLVLNLVGLATTDHVQFRVAPLHIWTDSPEIGTQWEIELTAFRTQAGEPAMIWVDNIHITEGAEVLFDETFPVQPTSAPEPFGSALVPRLHVYPNPVRSDTKVDFRLSRPGFVDVRVLDVSGRMIRSLLSRRMAPGHHTVSWDGLNGRGMTAPGGVYLIRLEGGGDSAVQKVVKVD
jgi:hypothetical protein